MNIQDPFELNHNVAGNVGQKHMITFTKCIRNAALACDMKIFNKNPGVKNINNLYLHVAFVATMSVSFTPMVTLWSHSKDTEA